MEERRQTTFDAQCDSAYRWWQLFTLRFVALLEIPVTFGLNGEKGNLILPLQLVETRDRLHRKGRSKGRSHFDTVSHFIHLSIRFNACFGLPEQHHPTTAAAAVFCS